MAERQDIIEIVKEFYIKAKQEFDISKIILFGSYANNDYHLDSDIDVAVLLNSSETNRRIAISSKLFKIATQIDSRIEPKCFFSDEVKNAEPASITFDIISNGLEVQIN